VTLRGTPHPALDQRGVRRASPLVDIGRSYNVRHTPRSPGYDRRSAIWFASPCHALECSAIHLTASCSVMNPLIASVSPSGHRISTPQPDPGFFRATKLGRCSDILRICACGGPVQASYPATIKLTHTAAGGCCATKSGKRYAAHRLMMTRLSAFPPRRGASRTFLILACLKTLPRSAI